MQLDNKIQPLTSAETNKVWIYSILSVSVLLHILAAYFNIGFIHSDEHYQILEFANYKLGNIEASTLPWEFNAHLRPSLQPSLTVGVIKILEFFGTNPFQQIFFLRLLSAFGGLISTYWLIKHIPESKKSNWSNLLIVFFSFGIWYQPFVHARYSSETASAVFMVLSLIYFFKFDKTKKWTYALICGILWGVSFEFRFQAGIFILFYGLWLLVFKTKDIKYHLLQAVGFILVLLISLGLDYWFYGELVFPPYNYYVENLINDVAAQYGTLPWDGYFILMKKNSFEVISIINIITLIYLLLFQKKHLITWLIVPFILIHSYIPHKELRFLFPLLYLMPYAMTLCFWDLNNKIKQLIKNKSNKTNEVQKLFTTIDKGIQITIIVLWIIMLPLALWKSTYPVQYRPYHLEYIYKHHTKGTLLNIYSNDYDYLQLEQRFYYPAALEEVSLYERDVKKEFSKLTKPVFVFGGCFNKRESDVLKFTEIHPAKMPFYKELFSIKSLKMDEFEVLYQATLKDPETN